ncbi:hypothetical protein [Streptomyces sp. YKOK-I1]
MTSCEPRHFCPDHPDAVGLSTLAAAGLLCLALLVVVGLALVHVVDRAAHRTRRTVERCATAVARTERAPGGDGRRTRCAALRLRPLLGRLTGPPGGPGHEDR